MSFLPYTKHIQELIKNIDSKTKQVDEEQNGMIYKGVELVPNFDKQLATKKILESQTTPVRMTQINPEGPKKKMSIKGIPKTAE